MIEYFTVGSCRHPERAAVTGGSFTPLTFPALAAYLPNAALLFDTGYADHFVDATRSFPERIYPTVIPVTFPTVPLTKQLGSRPVKTVFISHFHGDHIAGLRSFPNAEFICSKQAYQAVVGVSGRVGNLRRGVLPALIPGDFRERVTFVEDLPSVRLPDAVAPFTHGFKVATDVFAVPLPGHAAGHVGLYDHNDGVFLVGDAVWQSRTITEDRRPSSVTRVVMDHWGRFNRTIDDLQALYRSNGDVMIVPSHCATAIASAKSGR